MKKTKIILITLSILLISKLIGFALESPWDDNVGGVIGRFYMELDKDWKELKAGKYYKGKLFLVNKDTGEKFNITPDRNGYFYILNLDPGNYVLQYFSYSITVGYTTYRMGNSFGKTGIDFPVSAKKLTALKTIISFHEILPRDESKHNVDPYHQLQPMNKKIIRDENLDLLKEYFSKLDKRGKWSDFEWNYEGSE